MHTVVIANAPGFAAAPFARHLRAAALIIAADGGANALYEVGLAPHTVIGDNDSLHETVLAWLQAQGCELVRLPQEKDETDLEMALLLAVERGASTIDVLGALGGRLDHTLANITMLTMEPLAGRRVRLLDEQQELFAVRGGESLELSGQQGDTVSLLPLTPAASSISLRGLYYPLQDATLSAARARGVSNVLLEHTGHISVQQGTLLVLHHFDGGAHQWESYQ
jgi:thiamine pyrophosphokinase